MRGAVAACLALCAVMSALAQENGDLDRIPQAVQDEPVAPPPDATAHGKYFLEDDFVLSSARGALTVPSPSPSSSDWANRLSFDAFDQWSLGGDLTLTYSDRLSVTEADGIAFPSEAVRNNLREAYLSWEPLAQTYLEVGRINLKNGIALGFNPTDFFKTRTAVAQASADPSALREDRLGTLMLRAQTIWDGGSLTFAFAPKIHTPRAITGPLPNAMDPGFDQTNTADRFLLALNFEIEELSPQLLFYHESGRTKFGFNISHPIGQSIIAYAEWAGGVQSNLIAQAIDFGKATGTLPAAAPFLPPATATRAFQNDLAIGASWTSAEKVTLNLEYHYHQAGFGQNDWRNWLDIGTADPSAAPELWYVRGFASDQQQPMTRHQVFLRADWQDAFIPNLELSAISFVNFYDGSGLSQLSASYYLSDRWTVGGYVGGTFGGRHSEWGSLPSDTSAIFQLVRYF
ncbi:MAG: hypothetical protein KGJ53_03660 [Alphaproteobacteria bacterium]|nr:hypothetical protein [Alphaproteobacteria bacterium]